MTMQHYDCTMDDKPGDRILACSHEEAGKIFMACDAERRADVPRCGEVEEYAVTVSLGEDVRTVHGIAGRRMVCEVVDVRGEPEEPGEHMLHKWKLTGA